MKDLQPEPAQADADQVDADWNPSVADSLIREVLDRVGSVTLHTPAAQLRRLDFWKRFGRAQAAQDMAALRTALTEFEKWMIEAAREANEFWAKVRARAARNPGIHAQREFDGEDGIAVWDYLGEGYGGNEPLD